MKECSRFQLFGGTVFRKAGTIGILSVAAAKKTLSKVSKQLLKTPKDYTSACVKRREITIGEDQ